MITERKTCRACGGSFDPLLDLGNLVLSTFLDPSEPDPPKAPLEAVICQTCDLVQLRHEVDQHQLFGTTYWYRCIGASEKLFARVRGHGRLLDRDALVHDTADRLLRLPYHIELPCVTKAGEIEWRPILHREVSTQEVYVIEFYTGARVVASANHRWPLLSGMMTWLPEKTTAELNVGDRVGLVHNMTRPIAAVDHDSIYDYDAGYFVGAYLAEGCQAGKTGRRLTLHETKDLPMLERIQTFVTGRLYEGLSVSAVPQSHVINVHVSGAVVNGLLDKFIRGHHAKGKRLDAAVWAQPLPFIRGILDAWLDGDGSLDQAQERWRFNICRNSDLVEDLALACRLVGYRMRYRLRQGGQIKGAPKCASQPNQYCGWVRKSDARMRQHLRLGTTLGAVGVRRIWKQSAPKRTWDVAIGGDELYALGCGVVTHNSGINETMRAELQDVAAAATSMIGGLREHMVVLDVGANDGTGLGSYPKKWVGPRISRLGVEPAAALIPFLSEKADVVFHGFFPQATQTVPSKSVHILQTIAMFYDLNAPREAVAEIDRLLAPDGVWVVQMQDLAQMVQATAFDNFCFEHATYYSLRTFEHLLSAVDLHVVKVEQRKINGGSLRFYVRRKQQTVDQTSVDYYRKFEAWLTQDALTRFAWRVGQYKTQLLGTLDHLARRGQPVDLYGASTKASTLLQYCGIDHSRIRCGVERTPEKVGKVTSGTRIPIISEEAWRLDPAPHTLVGIWQWRTGILQREEEYLDHGGSFIFPLPVVEVVGGVFSGGR